MAYFRPGDALLTMVREMHLSLNLPVSQVPAQLSVERLRVRSAWLREEVDELTDSTTFPQQVDAVLDIVYLALGCLVEMGVDLDEPLRIVHEANLRKRWPDGSVHTDAAGKLQKPPGWVSTTGQLEEYLLRCGATPS